MAKTLSQEERAELSNILEELKNRGPEDEANQEEFQSILSELTSRSNIKQEKPQAEEPELNLFEDILQATKEIPSNLSISITDLRAAGANALASRGIQLNYTAGVALGFSDKEIMKAFNPQDMPTTARERVAQEMQQFATDVEGPVSTHPLGFILGLANEFGKDFRRVGKDIEAQAQKKREQLPATSFSNSPITKISRAVSQNTSPLIAAAGVSILTGSPAVGLAFMGETAQGSEFFTQTEGGASIPKAALISNLSEAVEIGTELMVFPKLLKGLKGPIPLREGIELVLQNAGQETVAGFSQAFMSTYGLETSKGLSKSESAKLAFDAGIQAIPESAIVGGALGFGSQIVGQTAGRISQKVSDKTSKVELSGGVKVSRAQTQKFNDSYDANVKEHSSKSAATIAFLSSLQNQAVDGIDTVAFEDSFEQAKEEGKSTEESFLVGYDQALQEKITVNTVEALVAEETQAVPKKEKPGSVTEEAPPSPSTPLDVQTKNLTVEPVQEVNPDAKAQNSENINTQRVVANSKGIDTTVKPADQLAAELLDAQNKDTKASTAHKKEWLTKRSEIAALQTDLKLSDTNYRKLLYSQTEKNSTTAMTLNEMDSVLTEMRNQKADVFITEQPERLGLTEKETAEFESKLEVSDFSKDIWRLTLENWQTPLPQDDPFIRKKLLNSLNTSVRVQEQFAKRNFNKTNESLVRSKLAQANEKVTDFFGDWASFRHAFSDLSQQTGVDVHQFFQNLVDSRGKAVGDSDRAFGAVLQQHGLKRIPYIPHGSIQKINRALYFGVTDDTDYVSQLNNKEKKFYDAAVDMFHSDPARPNTGPNAVRLRSYQWKVWNDAYNLYTPQITDANTEAQAAKTRVKILQQEISTKEASRLESLNTELVEAETRLEEVDRLMIETLKSPDERVEGLKPPTPETEVQDTAKGLGELADEITKAEASVEKLSLIADNVPEGSPVKQALQNAREALVKAEDALDAKMKALETTETAPVTQQQVDPREAFALLAEERFDLPKTIENLQKELKKGISKDPLKKELSKSQRVVRKNDKKVKEWKKKINTSKPMQGLGEGKAQKAEDATLLQGKKAMEEGTYYDWLRRQTFGTRDIYFTNDEGFDQWYKSVNDSMKPGEIDRQIGSANSTMSDTAARSRVKEGSPLLNQNPFIVAKNRLTKLSMLDELYHPLTDMNRQMDLVWDDKLTNDQRKNYKKWMDNMTGTYDDAGKMVDFLRTVQRQWWRAKGWNPQFMAKFFARNIGQLGLTVGQVNTIELGKAAPKAYAGAMFQFQQQRLETKKQNNQQLTEADQVEFLDAQKNLRDSLKGELGDLNAVIDPFLIEDWATFAAIEVSQKAAQFNMLMHNESNKGSSTNTRYSAFIDSMPKLMSASDTMNRFATYIPLHQMAFDNIKQFRQGKIKSKQLWSRLSLDTLEAPQVQQLMRLLEAGDDRTLIRQYANMKTKNVHYAYDLAERSAVEQHAGGRLLAGVITWPRSALENYVRLHKKGVEGFREGDIQKSFTAYTAFAKYLGMFGFLGWSTKELVGEAWYGILRSINPLDWFGSPQLNFVDTMIGRQRAFWNPNTPAPTQDAVDAYISALAEDLGTLALPAAVGMLEGYKTAFEATNDVKGVKAVDLVKDMLQGSSEAFLGSKAEYRTEQGKLMKFFFDAEAEEEF